MNPAIADLRKTLSGFSGRPAVEPHPLRGAGLGGSLVEWCSPVGMPATTIGLSVVRELLTRRSGMWAVVDPAGEFFPLPAWGWGIPLSRMLILRPETPGDADWAIEQCLRSRAVAVTWAWIDAGQDRLLRRWKRAAEVGGGTGVLFRTDERGRTGLGADLRWRCRKEIHEDSGRSVGVELDYGRGSLQGRTFEVQVHDAQGGVSVVSGLAASEAPRRAAGA